MFEEIQQQFPRQQVPKNEVIFFGQRRYIQTILHHNITENDLHGQSSIKQNLHQACRRGPSSTTTGKNISQMEQIFRTCHNLLDCLATGTRTQLIEVDWVELSCLL